MKKLSYLVLLFICLLSCGSKKKIISNTDNYNYVFKNKMLIGHIPITAITKDTINFKWFKKRYNNYNVKDSITVKLKPLINDVTFEVYLGTWCPDTKLMLPKFIKILEDLDYNLSTINFYALDRNKKELQPISKDLNIKYVPTIIVYKNGKVLNRIVEYHVESVEADLLNILTTNTY